MTMMNNAKINLGLPQIFKNPTSTQDFEFVPVHLDVYIFLYGLYKEKTESKTLNEIIMQKNVPDNIKKVFFDFKKQGKDFSSFNFNDLTTQEIKNIFFRVSPSNKDLKEDFIQNLVFQLLNINSNDKLAVFFANATKLAEFYSNNSSCSTIHEYFFNEKTYIYDFMRNEILGIKKTTFFIDEREFLIPKEKRYTKVFAFPPIYRKLTGKATLPQYESQINVTTEDNIQNQVQNLINNLEENGTAVLLVSGSIFTRNYKEFHKFLVKQRYLTEVISLPRGVIRPTRTSTVLMVFNKTKSNKGIRFLDLKNKSLDYLCENTIYDFDELISYEKIEQENDFNLAISRKPYFDPIAFLEANCPQELENRQSDTIERAVPQMAILGEEAEIFRGFSSIQISDLTEQPESNYKVINIVDIENGKINDQKLKYIKKAFLEKNQKQIERFKLLETDILITKTTSPIKIAFPPKSDCILVATGNIYVIRLKPTSKINPFWLNAYLHTNEAYNALIEWSDGGTIRVIAKSTLEKMIFETKTVAEQDYFVHKLKQKESEIEELEKKLNLLKNDYCSFIECHFLYGEGVFE